MSHPAKLASSARSSTVIYSPSKIRAERRFLRLSQQKLAALTRGHRSLPAVSQGAISAIEVNAEKAYRMSLTAALIAERERQRDERWRLR